MEIADLMIIIKWFFVWGGVTFVLGGALMLYLKNAEYAAKSAEKQANEKQAKDDAIKTESGALLDTDENVEKEERKVVTDENSGNKSQDSGD